MDADDTINSVIKNMMLTKLTNASRILLDGTDVGATGGGSSGMGLDAARTLGSMMKSMISSRHTSDGGTGGAARTPAKSQAPKRDYDEHRETDRRAANEGNDVVAADGEDHAVAPKKALYISDSDEDSEEELLLERSAHATQSASVKAEAVHDEINLVDSDEDDI